MREIRTLIVDDEPLARSKLRRMLSGDPEIRLLADCADAFDAVRAIHDSSPDLIFLDIQMPEKDGFSVIDEVGVDRMPHTVFVTAYDQHAVRAFECNALDYLLKPYNEERLSKALRRAKRTVTAAQSAEFRGRILNAVEQLRRGSDYLERILIKAHGRLFFLNLDEVDWIKSEGNYLRLYAGQSSYVIRGTVQNFISRVDPNLFLRIGRSVIVNVRRVKEMVSLTHGDYKVFLRDGTELTFSRHYRDGLARFESRST